MIKKLIKNLSNIPGWRTSRKIVVIESDDWASLRMSSNKTINTLLSKGVDLNRGISARYNLYDTLASKEDLSHLFDVLTAVKDKNGESAKMTIISLVANPDFEKIKAHNFEAYFYEPFTKTLDRYNRSEAFKLWQEGIQSNIFLPEFHGREHLNVQAWLRALKSKDKDALLAFDHEVWGYKRKRGIGFQAAFGLEFASDLDYQKLVIMDGLKVFKTLHGYDARFFVPPNGPINNQLETIAARSGIKFISTPKIQREVLGEERTRKHFRYLGKSNKHSQIYLTRNAFFEPSGALNDQVNSCLKEIKLAFDFKKPAIISSHRVNYIGGLSEKNRTAGLIALNSLLKQIVKYWPDIEFMTSTELGDTISRERQSQNQMND